MAASPASRVSRGVMSASTSPVAMVYGKSCGCSMLSRRTATGSSSSARAIASIVPSITQLVIAMGARIGPLPTLLVNSTLTSKL